MVYPKDQFWERSFSLSTLTILIVLVQQDLDKLNKWFQNNLLTINVAKTNYVVFAAKNKKIEPFAPLTINNQLINGKTNEKYLGLVLDDKLTWRPHIDKIRTKLRSLTGALRISSSQSKTPYIQFSR